MKKAENKKFGFEKFEMAKLTVLKKTQGGIVTGDTGFNGGGDDTVTDILSVFSTDKCMEDKKNTV